MIPRSLHDKIKKRKNDHSFRSVSQFNNLIDFSSNDYLDFANSSSIFQSTYSLLKTGHGLKNGSSGSRLLTGNHPLYTVTEEKIAKVHNSESALIFNSGYDANIGLLSSVLQRKDIIFYDEFAHASIRDGIQLSKVKAYKFKHNDIDDLSDKIKKNNKNNGELYIITESVFSMDGDTPDFNALIRLSQDYGAHLIIDEAHAVGVMGKQGLGIIQELGIEQLIFARIITFGKALGCHGAAVLGASELKDYLVNFARSFIYTTGLPPHSLGTIHTAYDELGRTENIEQLKSNISFFKSKLSEYSLESYFIESDSAIHSCIIEGNDRTKAAAEYLKDAGFNVKPILSPSVPIGKERLRFCLHSFNTKEEIDKVLSNLSTFVLSLNSAPL